MTNATLDDRSDVARLPNGAGVAAILAAGLGSFTMAALAIAADHSTAFKKLMIFFTPTGPLSGVTTIGIAVWLLSWIGLDFAWKRRDVHGWLVAVGLCLLATSFILMFPPFGDLF